MRQINNIKIIVIIYLLFFSLISSCEEFVEVDVPKTDLIKASVFSNEATAEAAILGAYNQMSFHGFASGDLNSCSYLTSLSSDELLNYNTGFNQEFQQFNDNSILPSNSFVTKIWSDLYQYIYKVNSIIEGLESSTGISENLKTQLKGEAKFIRAFSHFYLVNLFGDVPLIMSTDYRVNATIGRNSKTQVYQQIIDDLIEAESLLSEDYSFSQGERVRANKWAARALMARTYLYIGDFAKAEDQATLLIQNAINYSLVADLDNVFLKNSTEAILQLSFPNGNTNDAGAFYFSSTPQNSALHNQLVNAFETGDKRKTRWIGSNTIASDIFYYSNKYKALDPSSITEYSMVLRLAEQYLIRAEARAAQNNISGAVNDLNLLRQRSGLVDLPNSLTQAQCLRAIEHERRVELFTEWGHRWLDLKRTNRVDAVLGSIKPDWQPYKALYPIPIIQILNNPNMTNAQNPGY